MGELPRFIEHQVPILVSLGSERVVVALWHRDPAIISEHDVLCDHL